VRPNRLKQLWREGKPARVVWESFGDPLVAEVLANVGFDAILLDMQHGFGITPDRVATCLQAISTTTTVPLVRVPWNDPVHVQYVLDAGAYGVIVPLVNTPAEAERAVAACRYPPLGSRSIGANRAPFYAGPDYYEHANEEIICFVMIEKMEAVEQVDQIARVPGVDGLFIGPGDLALSLGLPPTAESTDPRHVAACQRVLDAARSHGLVAGIAAFGPDEARRRIEQGFTFCPFGSDRQFIASGGSAALASYGASAPA
jgi:4-hydroxy-2-oxoheptanedioate aldolase